MAGSPGRRGPVGRPGKRGLPGKITHIRRTFERVKRKIRWQKKRRGRPHLQQKDRIAFKFQKGCPDGKNCKKNVRGRALSATTKLGLAGSNIFFFKGKHKVASTKTDLNGYYEVQLPHGIYRVHAAQKGYSPNLEFLRVPQDYSPRDKNLVLSPALKSKDSMRLVLTWESEPQDLDAFVLTPTGCMVSYRKRACNWGGQNVSLDVDSVHGHGPETISIQKPMHGTYYYFVRQTSANGAFMRSQAVVRVYFGDGRRSLFRLGHVGQILGGSGRGQTWLVMKIDGKTQAITDGGKVSSGMRTTIFHLPIKPGKNPGAEGQVMSVTTALAMPKAHVFFKKAGKIVKATRTNSVGKYWVPLADGRYEVYAKKAGFVGVTQHLVIRDGRKRYLDPIISRALQPGQARFVVTWSHNPADLDSYLLTPSGCMVWYGNKQCPGAVMDTESGNHRGPETITITDTSKGKFVFFVKQQSERGEMRDSLAIARLFTPDSSVRMFRIGTDGKIAGPQGQGRGWIVASINHGTVNNGSGESAAVLKLATPTAAHKQANKKRLHRVMQLVQSKSSE